MAGSRKRTGLPHHAPPSPLARGDAALHAHLDAIRSLGERASEPVAVIDRHFNLVYANRQAHDSADCHTLGAGAVKCHAAFVGQSNPCPTCPAQQAFEEDCGLPDTESGPLQTVSCGAIETFPLHDAAGERSYVVQILKPSRPPQEPDEARDSVALGSAEPAPDRLGDLIGRSAAMQDLFELIRLVADSQATVLLQGESGTGKELVARTVHRLSARRDRPFVVVDCGSLTETLLESELFGHVRGAFTGAHANKKGLFEEAHGGTIFLDEIASTTPHFQSKLLRVLQEGEIKPVGSSRSTNVDVRVVSASNKDLLALCRAKAFREDLYYRLAVLPLVLPPLRERREDVPLLLRAFLDAACRRHGKKPVDVADEAVHAMLAHDWPGNVRELEHVVERAVVTSPHDRLTASDFFGRHKSPATAQDSCLRSVAKQALQTAERSRILEALRHAAGNRAKAARLLKISRASLYNKLRAYHISS